MNRFPFCPAKSCCAKVRYSDFLPAALALAQRARATAAILARAAALILRRPLLAAGLPAFTFAQRAFCAAIMRARPAALMRDFLRGALGLELEGAPKYRASSSCSRAIFS